MRNIEYLSPSAIDLYKSNQRDYYLNYLTPNRIPRQPQTRPMSVGSAFDSYIKSYLHEHLFGKGYDPKFDLDTLLEAQVEKQNLDWARINGKYVFEMYLKSGAATDLMLELESAVGTPKFELEIKGVVDGYRDGVTKNIKGVTLLGKPDVFYINKYGAHVILDFKVNGYCGNYLTNPMHGYLKIRTPGKDAIGVHHHTCYPYLHNGTLINVGTYLETLNPSWARQLSIYSWLLGVNIGGDFIAQIDQICANGTKRSSEGYPEIRVVEHKLKVSSEFQWQTFADAQTIWDYVHSDHFFRDLSKEENDTKCLMLDEMARLMSNNDLSDRDKWLWQSSKR